MQTGRTQRQTDGQTDEQTSPQIDSEWDVVGFGDEIHIRQNVHKTVFPLQQHRPSPNIAQAVDGAAGVEIDKVQLKNLKKLKQINYLHIIF